MAAAMCTSISPHHYLPHEEPAQQRAMDSDEDDAQSTEVVDNMPTTNTSNSAFARLPDEIVEQILRFADSNSFASLIILNKNWRRISQQPQLYAHHLSGCRSYSASHFPPTRTLSDADLPRLRSMFAQEVKRNLFDCYLRPRETFIKLVSTSISSSAAFPGGEAFHFSFSSNGNYVLAYSSSRICVLDVAAQEVVVKRELKILRRPSTATLLDDGSILALLSTDHQVDIYDISDETPKHTRVIALDHTPRTIALSPEGSVLAVGYEGGVEVYSLAACALPTDRRAVKCDPSDSLSFSPDGTQLLGTTVNSQNPSTVILTAPYYNPLSQMPEESISQLWTTSILFPNSSRDCSHATLLPSVSENDSSWTFTYDKVFESFRAVRIDDLRNGTTYFTGPTADSGSAAKLLPSTLPAANRKGEIVAAGFQGRQIWIYGVPEDLEAAPEIVHNLSGNGDSMLSSPTSHRRDSAISQETSLNRAPQWQSLADRFRNTFVEGRNVAELEGAKAMKWVSQRQGHHTERLVVVAPGIVEQQLENEEDGLVPMDGGRLLLLDFMYGSSNGGERTLTIEIGNTEPQVLEEEQRDLDAEVAIVRRRTIAAQRRTNSNMSQLGVVSIPSLHVPASTTTNGKSPSHLAAEAAQLFRNLQLANEEDNVSLGDEEQEEVFDAPYSHSSPRSGNTLRRAATVAANHRRLHPRMVVTTGPPGMRRTDGTELPHESDADNWVPPPPPYSREPIEPLPEHLRNAIIAGNVRTLNRASPQPSPRPILSVLDDGHRASLHRSRSTNSPRPSLLQRTVSDSVTISSRDISDFEFPRPSSTPSFYQDIYGVSPPSSPRPPRTAEPVSPETDELSLPSPNPVTSDTAQSQSQRLMRATLLQPVSPIPQPIQAWERASTAWRLEDWESTNGAISDQVSTIELERESGQQVTQNRLQASVPRRPNEDHHMTSFSPSPVPTENNDDTESGTSMVTGSPALSATTSDISQQVFDAAFPEVISTIQPLSDLVSDMQPLPELVQSPIVYEGALERPSDDLLARLNSRTGRPPARILTDPSRRRSGSGSGSSTFELNASPISQQRGSGFNSDPSRFSNEPSSSFSGRNRSGSGSSTTRGSRAMPPVSLDTRHRTWVSPGPGSPLTNLAEMGDNSTVSDDTTTTPVNKNKKINHATNNVIELPVFAPQPTRPTYPTHADRRNSGYSTPPRVNTPPRSNTNTPPANPSSPSRSIRNSNNIQTQSKTQQVIKRRPVTSYNTYPNSALPSTSQPQNRRHSGLAFEISSSPPTVPQLPAGVKRNRESALSQLQSSASNPNFRSGSLARLDTIRSMESIDNLGGGDAEKDMGRTSMFGGWRRGRRGIGPASQRRRDSSLNRRRETADWADLIGERSVENLQGVMGRSADRSQSRDRFSVLATGKRSERAVSKENSKRRGKRTMGSKCAVM